MSILGYRIAHRRGQLRLSQEDLAQKADTSQKQISKYENGLNTPSSEVIAKIATALETTTDYLLGLTESSERALRTASDLDDLEIEAVRLMRSQDFETRQKMISVLKAMA